jgi:hypothetical protein
LKVLIAVLSSLALVMPVETDANEEGPRSRAERTDYSETSRYSDVMEFIAALQRVSSAVKVETFGVTNEGRALPLVVLSKPAIDSPSQAVRSGKPIVFIMANIHAGEVEGKEATLHLMRDVVSGPLSNLLNRVILLVAPIYNADGNEKIDINNRTAQNGPRGGVGTRENARQMDLNRDFIKLESPEARGLIEGVFNRWDPHVVIDLHTTNGSHHGYALTYSPSLNPNTDQRLISFTRDRLLADASKTLRSKHRYRTYFYGNFVDQRNPQRELGGDAAKEPKVWATFDHRPRFGNNYVGLRNRIAILSEAYSYLDFRRRVDVTDKFVRAILDNIAARAPEIVDLISEVDRHSVDAGTTVGNDQGFGIAFELKASPKPVEILVGSVNRVVDPRTSRPRFEANDEAKPVKMMEYAEFQPTRRVKPAAEYILKPPHRKAVDLLLAHGIVVEQTTKEETLEVEHYSVTNVTRAARVFQGHRETKLSVSSAKSRVVFPPGSFIVAARQAKAALVIYLLEAESDDGLASWNYFDEELDKRQPEGAPSVYPVYRLASPARVPREVVRR